MEGIYMNTPSRYCAVIEHSNGVQRIVCGSMMQAQEEMDKAQEMMRGWGWKIKKAYIESGDPAKEESESFTHYKIIYKSSYGGRSIVFIPKGKDLDEELDRLEDEAGIIEISKVTRHFATSQSRLNVRFEAENFLNHQNRDTDAQLSGLLDINN